MYCVLIWQLIQKFQSDLGIYTFKTKLNSDGVHVVDEYDPDTFLVRTLSLFSQMIIMLPVVLAKKLSAPLEISPLIVDIFKEGQKKYGPRAWSSMIVKRMEDINKINFRANGFPEELIDNQREEIGHEI